MISPGAAIVYLCRKLAFDAIKSFEKSEPFPIMRLPSPVDLAAKKTKTTDYSYHRKGDGAF